jgi:hypothetical protein
MEHSQLPAVDVLDVSPLLILMPCVRGVTVKASACPICRHGKKYPSRPPLDPAALVQQQLSYFVTWVETSVEHANDRLMERLERAIEALVERAVARAMERYVRTELQVHSERSDRSIRAEERAQRSSFRAIADQLNAEGVPTLSGKGSWQKGTISNLLSGRK